VHGSALVCDKLTRIDVEVGNLHFITDCGFLRSYDGSEMVRYFGRDVRVVIPPGVGVVQESCFHNCWYLVSIDFGRGSQMRILSEMSMSGCSSLRRIVVPGSTEVIGASAFQGCLSLELCEFERPAHLGRIEGRAFAGCSSLASIDFPGSLEFVGMECFADCSALSRLVFDSGRSLERLVGDLVLDEFLVQVGIEVMTWDFAVGVRDGAFGRDLAGWICECCDGGAAYYRPEWQRSP
jgi:hypothetical protein